VKPLNKFVVEKSGNIPVPSEHFHHTFKPPGNPPETPQNKQIVVTENTIINPINPGVYAP
jgi:hypothetical protein